MNHFILSKKLSRSSFQHLVFLIRIICFIFRGGVFSLFKNSMSNHTFIRQTSLLLILMSIAIAIVSLTSCGCEAETDDEKETSSTEASLSSMPEESALPNLMDITLTSPLSSLDHRGRTSKIVLQFNQDITNEISLSDFEIRGVYLLGDEWEKEDRKYSLRCYLNQRYDSEGSLENISIAISDLLIYNDDGDSNSITTNWELPIANNVPASTTKASATLSSSLDSDILPKWSARFLHQVVVDSEGRFWLFGGAVSTGDGDNTNVFDIWTSLDGVNWTLITNRIDIADTNYPLARHQMIIDGDGLFWIFQQSGVYYSEDIINWILITNSIDGFRTGYSLGSPVVIDKEENFWFLNFSYSVGIAPGRTMYKSADGNNWEVAANLPNAFEKRSSVTPLVYHREHFWIFGGGDVEDLNYYNDIWVSSNGLHWNEVTENAPWKRRISHQVVVKDNGFYLMGGQSDEGTTTTYENDVWWSADGTNWTFVTNAPWSGRRYHQVVVKDNALWVTGGRAGVDTQFGDIWKSEDGTNWEEPMLNLSVYAAVDSHHLFNDGDQYYLVGGRIDNGNLEAIYRTRSDTLTSSWDLLSEEELIFFSAIVRDFAGTIYQLGGSSGGRVDDIYSSPSFTNFDFSTPLTTDAGWSGRSSHRVVVDAYNRLWLFGGKTGESTTYNNEIWYSDATRTNWTQVTPEGDSWSGRSSFGAVYDHHGRFIIVGGEGDSLNNEVWTSTNGTNWTMTTAPFEARYAHSLILDNYSKSSLYLYGGRGEGDAVYGDLWQSTNGGASWVEVNLGTDTLPRYGHAAVLDNEGRLIITGGFDESDIRQTTVIVIDEL